MKDGLRFVDCDMHIMEPVDLLDKYLDKKFRDRVILPVDAQGKLKRGMIVIDPANVAGSRTATTPQEVATKSEDGNIPTVVGVAHGGGRVSQLRH